MDDRHTTISRRYRDFADYTRGESSCFTDWALGVAEDLVVQRWLEQLPLLKQQPNLVFAAARFHGVPAPGPYRALREALLSDGGQIRDTIRTRRTQTNEVGRLATLVPVLAGIEGPLALLEVGASAGLCLYPDRYDYAWPPLGGLTGSGGPTLSAFVEGEMPAPMTLPRRHPDVAWRGGLDLHPLDVTDEDDTAWLETLVWPEQDERCERLRAAVEVARTDPPHLVAGHALTALPDLLEEARAHGTVVVLHSAVVAYFDPDERATFELMMRDLVAAGRCRWVSNEAPGVVPGIAVPEPALPTRFLLAVDGDPVAWTHGHGADMRWLGPEIR